MHCWGCDEFVFSYLSTVSVSSDESGRPVYSSVCVPHHHHHHHHHGRVGVTRHVKNAHFLLFPALQRSGIRNRLLKLLITWPRRLGFISERVRCCGRRFALRRNVEHLCEWNSSPVPETEHSDTMMRAVLRLFYNIHAGVSYVKVTVIRATHGLVRMFVKHIRVTHNTDHNLGQNEQETRSFTNHTHRLTNISSQNDFQTLPLSDENTLRTFKMCWFLKTCCVMWTLREHVA